MIEKASEKVIPYNAKEMAKIRRKVTEELVQQMLTKKMSDKMQEDMDNIKRAINPLAVQATSLLF